MMFLGIVKVNAKTLNAELNLGDTAYFNVFVEFNNQTPLAKFLIEHGYNLLDYLIAEGERLTGNGNESAKPNAVHLYKSRTSGKYFITLLKLNQISVRLNSFDFTFGNSAIYIFTYDANMNLEKCEFKQNYTSGVDTYVPDITSLIGGFPFYEGDLTEILSRFYYVNDNSVTIDSAYDRISIMYVNQDDNYYNFDSYKLADYFNWKWVSSSSGFFKPNIDYSSNFDLTYYKNNAFYRKDSNTKFKSIGSILFEERKVEIPSGYQSFEINSPGIVYYLTYRGNVGDSKVYYYSTNSDTTFYSTDIKIGGSSIENGSQAVFKAEKPYTVYAFEPKEVYGVEDLNNHALMFFTEGDKYSQTIYYDPEVYLLSIRFVSSPQDIEFINNNGTFTYTASQFQKTYNSAVQGNQAIVNQGGGSSTGDNGSSSGNFDFSAGSVLNAFKSFTGAIGALGGSLTYFFATMPPEITGYIVGTFIMACVAIIIKIVL